MPAFSDLERAALYAIFDESPQITSLLRHQLEAAFVIARENRGGGFVTTMEVSDSVQAVSGHTVLGYEIVASIDGLAHGLGVALLIKEGRLPVLEGYSQAGEDTSALDFDRVGFSISKGSVKE